MKIFVGAICLTMMGAFCKNADEKALDTDASELWYDYKVSAEEGSEDVTVLIHYRAGEPTADAMPLQGSVELDGAALQGDSTQYTGTFYESVQPLQGFEGKHVIVTRGADGEHKQDFNFVPFALEAELPEAVKKAPFVIRLKDFPVAPTGLRLVITDTSFATPDVNEEIRVVKGQVEVDSAMLSALTTGPVTVEIYREEEQPVRRNGKRAGRLLITYGLKRELDLVR